MFTLGTKRKTRYRVDLSALQAVCAANYLGMQKLFPGMRRETERSILLGGGDSLQLRVLEAGPYTSLVAMSQQCRDIPLVPPRQCEVRVYHDVRLAEVVAWGTAVRKLQGRYRYPNQFMHQEDEKWQMNRFLGEWIQYCLSQGRSDYRPGYSESATGCDAG